MPISKKTNLIQIYKFLKRVKVNCEAEEHNKLDVIYLDEIYIHGSCSVNKCWQSKDIAVHLKIFVFRESTAQKYFILILFPLDPFIYQQNPLFLLILPLSES